MPPINTILQLSTPTLSLELPIPKFYFVIIPLY